MSEHRAWKYHDSVISWAEANYVLCKSYGHMCNSQNHCPLAGGSTLLDQFCCRWLWEVVHSCRERSTELSFSEVLLLCGALAMMLRPPLKTWFQFSLHNGRSGCDFSLNPFWRQAVNDAKPTMNDSCNLDILV